MRTKEQAIMECSGLLAMLRFYPNEQSARIGIMRQIEAMATTTHQVDWLAQEMTLRFNEWPGPQEMRALFCTRFTPADGHEASFPVGHRVGEEQEQKAIEQSETFKALDAGDPIDFKKLLSPSFLEENLEAEEANAEWKSQDHRWFVIGRKYPALPRMFKRQNAEFPAATVERREEILQDITAKLVRQGCI